MTTNDGQLSNEELTEIADAELAKDAGLSDAELIERVDARIAQVEQRRVVRTKQNCVACGRLSESRWCSDSCFRSEDGHDCDYDEIDDDE